MHISYVPSCAADTCAVNRLLKNVFGNDTKACAPKRLIGRYVLAFDGHQLVGMSDIYKEYNTCILNSYRNNGIERVLDSVAQQIRDEAARV